MPVAFCSPFSTAVMAFLFPASLQELGSVGTFELCLHSKGKQSKTEFLFGGPPCVMGSLSLEGAATRFILWRLLSSLCLPMDLPYFCDISSPTSFLQLAPARLSFCLLLHWLRRGKAFWGWEQFSAYFATSLLGNLLDMAPAPSPVVSLHHNVLIWDIWGVMRPLLFSVKLPPVSGEDATKRSWVLPPSASSRAVRRKFRSPLFPISLRDCRNLLGFKHIPSLKRQAEKPLLALCCGQPDITTEYISRSSIPTAVSSQDPQGMMALPKLQDSLLSYCP